MLCSVAWLLFSVSLYSVSDSLSPVISNDLILSHQRQRIRRNVVRSAMSTESVSGSALEGNHLLYKLDGDSSLYQINGSPMIFNEVSALYSLSVKSTNDEEKLRLKIHQKTSGPIPRSYLPSILVIHEGSGETADSDTLASLMEAGIRWYLDGGGRPAQLTIACPKVVSDHLSTMGFEPIETSPNSETAALLKETETNGETHNLYTCNTAKFNEFCKIRQSEGQGDAFTLYEIEGRLMHDMNRPQDSIKPYTQALQVNPKAAATFRNLGSAYHAMGSMQMAFASFQQAVQLDAQDPLVYLKLAFFYEEFASKDWENAEVHAQQCYEYYLANVDSKDMAILARLGNLLVREHKPFDAVQAYDRILAIDRSQHTAWFNKAHAQLKLEDYSGAATSLRETLSLEPSMSAARHMLIALVEEKATQATTVDESYIIELFDTYAPTFDSHGKKLLYSAPRVIRQELAKIYRFRFGSDAGSVARSGPLPSIEDPKQEIDSGTASPPDGPDCITGGQTDVKSYEEASFPVGDSCSSYTSFMNRSLDILDIGCGTGLAGAWLKDYAQNLVGVDISPKMVQVAREKGLYDDLYVMPIDTFFKSGEGKAIAEKFDVVVAADVFSYVGDLTSSFKDALSALRSEGLFVFTVESIEDSGGKGYQLTRTGRFKYSKKYLSDLINSELGAIGDGVTILMDREYSHQLDAGYAIPGFLYIVQKN